MTLFVLSTQRYVKALDDRTTSLEYDNTCGACSEMRYGGHVAA